MAIPVHVLTIDSVSGENGGTISEDLSPTPGIEPPLMHHQAYEGRLGRKLQAGDTRRSESSNSLGASVLGKAQSDKGSSLPKFGDWDVNDPASGVGFTAIFEKAVDEKKTGRATYGPLQRAASLLPIKFRGSSQSSAEGSSIRNWCCCCFHREG